MTWMLNRSDSVETKRWPIWLTSTMKHRPVLALVDVSHNSTSGQWLNRYVIIQLLLSLLFKTASIIQLFTSLVFFSIKLIKYPHGSLFVQICYLALLLDKLWNYFQLGPVENQWKGQKWLCLTQGYSYFCKLPNLVIEVNPFDDVNKSVQSY